MALSQVFLRLPNPVAATSSLVFVGFLHEDENISDVLARAPLDINGGQPLVSSDILRFKLTTRLQDCWQMACLLMRHALCL